MLYQKVSELQPWMYGDIFWIEKWEKMGAVRSSDALDNFHRTTWRHIREDITNHSHYCVNIKSH
jgi:hypothetical protein